MWCISKCLSIIDGNSEHVMIPTFCPHEDLPSSDGRTVSLSVERLDMAPKGNRRGMQSNLRRSVRSFVVHDDP